jgi:hypothetical protein
LLGEFLTVIADFSGLGISPPNPYFLESASINLTNCSFFFILHIGGFRLGVNKLNRCEEVPVDVIPNYFNGL